MLGFQVGHQRVKRAGAPGVTQARHHAGQAVVAGIGAQCAHHMRAHKPGARPGSKAAKVGSTLDRAQAVVADLKPQHQQVLADAGKPAQAGAAVWRKHDALRQGVFVAVGEVGQIAF